MYLSARLQVDPDNEEHHWDALDRSPVYRKFSIWRRRPVESQKPFYKYSMTSIILNEFIYQRVDNDHDDQESNAHSY